MSKKPKVQDERRDTGSISGDDIANKFSELKDELEVATGLAKGTVSKVGVVAGVALVIVAFLLGSRRGKRNKTVVEVRRL